MTMGLRAEPILARIATAARALEGSGLEGSGGNAGPEVLKIAGFHVVFRLSCAELEESFDSVFLDVRVSGAGHEVPRRLGFILF